MGLRRARVIPLWAAVAVGAATVFFATVGSQPWSSALWTRAVAAGLAPAAATMLRRANPGADVPTSAAPVPA